MKRKHNLYFKLTNTGVNARIASSKPNGYFLMSEVNERKTAIAKLHKELGSFLAKIK